MNKTAAAQLARNDYIVFQGEVWKINSRPTASDRGTRVALRNKRGAGTIAYLTESYEIRQGF